MKLHFHGHACFEISSSQKKIIIDPWLKGNPQASVEPEEVQVDAVLVTHGHHDHLGDAVTIAKNCDAVIIAPTELAYYCETFGVKTHAMHIGGSFNFSFGKVKMTPAWHGSAVMSEGKIIYTGTPCGFLINMENKIIYHAGDTALFKDMELLGEQYEIDVALLPIGDNFTMGMDDGVLAVQMLKPKVVIPMHYNTFPQIKQDVEYFVEKAKGLNMSTVTVLKPGEEFIL